MADTEKGNQFYDEIDQFTKWLMERSRKEKNSALKLN